MDFITKAKALFRALKSTNGMSALICSLLGIVVIGSIGIGGFTLFERYYGPEAMVSAEVNTEKNEVIIEEIVVTETETVEETEEVTETEMVTETETEEGPVPVTLVGSSI